MLVNNAAILRLGGVVDTSPEQFMDVVAVNQLGVFLGMQAVVPSMRQAGHGSIINVSSTGGLVGIPGNIAYNSSKWAVRGLTKSAVLELAPIIRVNSIHPGPIDTPMIHDPSVSNERFAAQWAPLVPLGRAGRPLDVAQAALVSGFGRLVVYDRSRAGGRWRSYRWIARAGALGPAALTRRARTRSAEIWALAQLRRRSYRCRQPCSDTREAAVMRMEVMRTHM